jgi:Icc-related predicted phosphoesterase
MNPKCRAFTVDTDEELAEKWAMIPDDTDILVTHCPPQGARDYTRLENEKMYWGYGSPSLAQKLGKIKPKLHVFGHIHESYGRDQNSTTIFVNASHVNERYEPVNKPIRVIL